MIVSGLLLTAVLGWLTLPGRLACGPVSGLSLGFLWMAFGLSAEMFLFDLVGLPWNPWLVLAPWLAAAGWMTYRERPILHVEASPGGWIALAAVVAVGALWLPYERAMPLTSHSWDAWAIWLFKAKAFYLDGGIGTYLGRSGEFTGQPGYPLLVPLYATWLYGLQGEAADWAAKLVSPAFFFALIGAIWSLLGRMAGSLAGGAGAALVALTVTVQRVAFDLAGYADTALSAYFVAAAGFLYLRLRDGARTDLAAASAAAAAAAWTKNEGQLFMAAVLAILAADLIRRRAGARDWALAALLPVGLTGAWSAMRGARGIEAAGFTPGLDFGAGLFILSARTLLSMAFSPGEFQFVFLLALVGAVLAARWRSPAAYWALPGLVAWQILGALLAYATGRNEIEWWLGTSAGRILAQVAPLAVLSGIVGAGMWPSAAATREERPSAGKPKPPAVRNSPSARRSKRRG